MIYYAVSEHDRTDLESPLPADAWFWQAGDRWVAVHADFHDDWWDGADPQDVAARPDPWRLPIDEMPKSGTLIYLDADGNGHTQDVPPDMTKQKRLLGICQMITGEIEEERAYEAFSEHMVRIATSDGGWTYLSWNNELGTIDMNTHPGSGWLPGSVRQASIVAPMWPQGDFQIAETLSDFLP